MDELSTPEDHAQERPFVPEEQLLVASDEQPQRRRRRVPRLATFGLAMWTIAAFAGGLTLGLNQRRKVPAPPADVVIKVEELAVPDSVAPVAEDEIRMVNVLGLRQSDALSVIGDAGLNPDAVTVTEVPQAGDAGLVVAQTPPPGSSETATLSLSVSAATPIPAVVGMSVTDAQDAVGKLGAVARTKSSYQKDAVPGTVLSVEPADGSLPSEVILTVASPPASIALTQLRPLNSSTCSTGDTVKVNGNEDKAAAQCRLSTTVPNSSQRSYTVDYDLSRLADRLQFVAGFTDDSSPDATAVVDVVVDGDVVSSQPIGFGQSVQFDVEVTNALRLNLVFTSTVATQPNSSSNTIGRAAVISASLTGSDANITALEKTNS